MLQNGRFIAAFRAKAPLDELVSRMPVAVILNQESGLLGAAVHANRELKALPYIRVLATKLLVGQGQALPEPLQNPIPFVFNFTRIR